MNGSDFGALMYGYIFRSYFVVFCLGAATGVGLWVGVPAFVHWFARHWH